jgi:hypothetical protein
LSLSDEILDAWSHLAAVSVLIPIFLAARIYPIWPRRFQGCDAFNILLNAECLRERKRLPIRLPPVFMLEGQDQWYPPGFLILCALLPKRWLEKRYWAVNHLIDLGSALLVYVAAVWFGASAVVAFAVAIFYAAVAGLVTEFASLNVRPIGLLLANLLMLAGFAATLNPHWLIGAGAVAVATFFSHKLTVQQLWFTLPALSAVTGSWVWLSLLGMLYVIPFVVWPKGAWRVLRGHWVIVRFWHRNWTRLGAHAVRQSPVYGDGHTRQDFYRDETAVSWLAYLKDGLHQNYFILPVLATIPSEGSAASPEYIFLWVWIASVYGAAGLIHFLKPLRGIGLGRQYFKFALAPCLIVTAVAVSGAANPIVWVATVVAAALTLRQYFLIARLMRQTTGGHTGSESDELERLLDRVAEDDAARVMTLPVHLCDLVAYRTRRPVYWGTHSDVFDDRLEAFFPVLNHDLNHYVRDGVTRLLLDTDYSKPEELRLSASALIDSSESYALYDLTMRDAFSTVDPR